MVIQELKPSARVRGRWLAKMEDGTILRVGESEIADFALYTGRDLNPEELRTLQTTLHRSGLRSRALELLSRKPQSRRELERKLEEWGAEEQEIEEICSRMEDLGYLNDETYAGQVVRHFTAKGYGPRKIRDELYRRGVPRELWDDAIEEEEEDPAEFLDTFIAKKMAGKDPDRKELSKVSAALARRGFDWEDIREAMIRYTDELEDD